MLADVLRLAAMGLSTQPTVMSFDESGYSQDCGCCQDDSGHIGAHCS